MLMHTYPGVYTQEQPSGVRSIAGAPTSVALFVGPTLSGIDNRPIRCLNYGDFERNFGGLYAKSSLSYSVLHFFANGGGQAFVLRLPAKGAKPAEFALLRDAGTQSSITLTALSSGAASNSIFVEVDPFEIEANPFSTNRLVPQPSQLDRALTKLRRVWCGHPNSSLGDQCRLSSGVRETGGSSCWRKLAVDGLGRESSGPFADFA